jgi:hypothetical protein
MNSKNDLNNSSKTSLYNSNSLLAFTQKEKIKIQNLEDETK